LATGRHTITHAKNVFQGDAQYTLYNGGKRGIEFQPIVKYQFDAPAALDLNGLVTKFALSSDADTMTLASSVTGASLSGTIKTLDIPRNVTITTSGVVAGGDLVVLVKGTDTYGATMWERFNVTTSDVTSSGKKAFKTITNITASDNTATSSLSMGFGDRFGLPFKLSSKNDILQIWNATLAHTGTDIAPTNLVLSTLTVSESHSATAAVTGAVGAPRDIRGTWKPGSVPDGTRSYSVWYKVADVDTKFGAFGPTQAAS